MPELIVTTFEKVLRVNLDQKMQVRKTAILDSGRGVYFGIARRGKSIFIAERNVDLWGGVQVPDAPTNAIVEWKRRFLNRFKRTGVCVTDPSFLDLHQIAFDDDSIFVTTGRPPFLVRKNIKTGKTVPIEIERAIPSHLRRQESSREDVYHFNSLYLKDDDLWVLAHNWDKPSFALSIDLKAARSGAVQPQCVIEGIGTACHDVKYAFGSLWFLDSGGSALVKLNDGNLIRYPVGEGEEKAFPRGLAVCGEYLVITYGFWSADRQRRLKSSSMLSVFDCTSGKMGGGQWLGEYGNTCDVFPL